MPRGGKRCGAGRRTGSSVLDPLEKLVVAGECQRLWNENYQERLAAAMAAHYSKSDYREATARVRQSYGRDAEALEDVEYSRREMAEMEPDDERDAPRVLTFQVGRPYGQKRRIIAEVAIWASERFGKAVSPGVVEAAWRIARKVEAEGFD